MTDPIERPTATDTVPAQDDDDSDDGDATIDVDDDVFKVGMFQSDFRPGARFIIVSDVIEWTPNVPANLGSPLNGYNTHMIAYLLVGERAPMFIVEQAELAANFVDGKGYYVDPDQSFGEQEFVQPQVYELRDKYSLYGETENILTGLASPVEEDVENQIFSDEGLDTEGEFQESLF